jgi:DNA-binding CsgD family transcriptional regulator/5-methylcytosine-specific restriction endonuclease McrA
MSELGDQVIALHEQGIKSLEISYRLGVAQSTVQYHLRRLEERPARPRNRRRAGRRESGSVPTRRLVAHFLAQGLDRAEVARRLGLAKSTVSYHARKLGEEMDGRFAKRFDWAVVQAYYDEGHSVRECARFFGFSTWSWSDAAKQGKVIARPAFRPLSEVFARNRGHLKTRLLRAGLKEGICERCGIAEWLGKPLSLALHHVNGDRLDNRLENLELLCPNCHSQTETYSGRNGHRRPSS